MRMKGAGAKQARTTCQLTRLTSYLDTYLSSAEHWIAVNVPESRTVLLVKTARRIQEPGFYSSLGSQSRQPIQLGSWDDTQLTW
jgi:hypothetical protein